jgi:hypothetical protein
VPRRRGEPSIGIAAIIADELRIPKIVARRALPDNGWIAASCIWVLAEIAVVYDLYERRALRDPIAATVGVYKVPRVVGSLGNNPPVGSSQLTGDVGDFEGMGVSRGRHVGSSA